MLLSAGGLNRPQDGPISVVIEGTEISTFTRLRFTQHFLTPTDSFSFDLSTEGLTGEFLDTVLVPGNKIEIFIGDAKQFTGYIDVVDTSNVDRSTGSYVSVEGRDTMSPVVDSQIDPDKHYPDKTPLDKFISDVLGPWFQKFDVENDANVEVAANLALKQKRGHKSVHHRRKVAAKPLKQYPLPKSKPEHNDSYHQFLSRILNRLGLWFWPSVDGDTCIVGVPNFDQDPIAELRRKRRTGTGNDGSGPAGALAAAGSSNIIRGGIRRDATEQPSFIVARGNIPPTAHEHQRSKVIIGNPFDNVLERILAVDSHEVDNEAAKKGLGSSGFNVTTNAATKTADDAVAKIIAASDVEKDTHASERGAGPGGHGLDESGTTNAFLDRRKVIPDNYYTYTPVKPIEIKNVFASKIAKPRFLKDRNSRTVDELTRFARRQMSLCTRKAFVATYTIAGLTIDGVIPVVDSVISVDDDLSMFVGNLWILGKEITLSRQGGVMTTITAVPLNSLQF